jgi:trimethylamine-N-oxide reductase (cytochrome c)
MKLLGGYTQQIRNPDSWEGWYWGAKHIWGNEPVGLNMDTVQTFTMMYPAQRIADHAGL